MPALSLTTTLQAPFDPDALREALPDWSPESQPDPTLQTYRDFYRLAAPPGGRLQQGALPLAGFRIACLVLTPPAPRGTLLLVHGYFDHMGLYRRLIEHYTGQGWRVIAFDLPGHGLSSGTTGRIDDFDDYQAVLEGVLAALLPAQAAREPLWLLGQSTGGAIVSHYLLRTQPPLEAQSGARPVPGAPGLTGAILLAPLVRPAQWSRVQRLRRCLGWLPGLPRRVAANSHDPEFVRFIREQDPLTGRWINSRWVAALETWVARFEALPPSGYAPLIVQGEGDRTLDWAYNLAVLQRHFPRARVLRLPGARHQLANESEAIRREYLGWLAAQGAP